MTDSTSYLPPEVLAAYDIGIIPLQVSVGAEQYTEGVDLSPSELAVAMRKGAKVSTSLPSPTSVDHAIRLAAGDGHDVCVVHISSVLSGTYGATQTRVQSLEAELGVDVAVVDSREVAMGLGFVALAGATAASAGASLADVVAAAEAAIETTSVLFLVETLEHLRRGGRLTASQTLFGTALSIKPILEVVDGAVVAKEKVRTTAKALARLDDLVVAAAEGRPVRLAVHHLDAADAAASLLERLTARLDVVGEPIVSEVGAVVGAHAGPGLLGAVISQA